MAVVAAAVPGRIAMLCGAFPAEWAAMLAGQVLRMDIMVALALLIPRATILPVVRVAAAAAEGLWAAATVQTGRWELSLPGIRAQVVPVALALKPVLRVPVLQVAQAVLEVLA